MIGVLNILAYIGGSVEMNEIIKNIEQQQLRTDLRKSQLAIRYAYL